jgi:hypothetical protein
MTRELSTLALRGCRQLQQLPPLNSLKNKRKKRANWGPRLTPEGLRLWHRRRGGRRASNAGQHGKRAATREGASNCAPDQQRTHLTALKTFEMWECEQLLWLPSLDNLIQLHTFVPASVETYGHLGRLIMRNLRTLSDVASARSLAVTRGPFLASAHRELSVALVQSQGHLYRSWALLLSKASGRPVLPGADTPYLD